MAWTFWMRSASATTALRPSDQLPPACAETPLIRTTIDPTPANGLRKRSQVMVDKAMTVKRDKIGVTIGHLDAEAMLAVTRALAVFFAIA